MMTTIHGPRGSPTNSSTIDVIAMKHVATDEAKAVSSSPYWMACGETSSV
ncbi:MAG: hypothetical protein Q8P13_01810 [bacterium]|nr:hypothetical protein [bacterium]